MTKKNNQSLITFSYFKLNFNNYKLIISREKNAITIHFFALSCTKHDLISFSFKSKCKKINKKLSKSATNKIKEE